MNSLSPQEVVGGFNRKESGARTWVYTRYATKIYDIVDQLTAHSPDTEDIVSEVFTRAFENEGRFSATTDIRDFLHVTAVNAAQDYLRHERVKKEKGPVAGEHYRLILAEDIERAEIYGYMGNFLWQQVEKMSPKTKEVITLAYKNDLKNKEIAERLGMTEKTVSNHKTDARKILKIEAKKRGGRNAFYLFVLLLNLLYEFR
ncbi:MAG: RNA polymerase sigma factor [Chitinophagales bacterium]